MYVYIYVWLDVCVYVCVYVCLHVYVGYLCMYYQYLEICFIFKVIIMHNMQATFRFVGFSFIYVCIRLLHPEIVTVSGLKQFLDLR